jgi:hypothetical protein
MIKNMDGTPFQLSDLRAFDPQNPEKDLFNSIDAEAIEINGTPLFYYEVFIDFNSIDQLYHESRNKVWSPNPVCLHTAYDPISSQFSMGAFGSDSPDEIMFEFNYSAVLKKLGHPPKIGSMIFTPHRSEYWVLVDRKLADWKNWHQIRLQMECKRFQESLTTGEGMATRKVTNIDIN